MTAAADDPVAMTPLAALRARRFSKMHGAGNDFVVLDLRDGSPPPTTEQCRALADRHVGVGCDQILTVEPPHSAAATAAYRIWNADGSASQQCGNGARCVAAWLAREAQRNGAPLPPQFTLDSPTGAHAVDVLGALQFRVAMGVPQFGSSAESAADGTQVQGPDVLDIDGVALALTAVSLGNPHAVIAVENVDLAPVASVGAAVQRHAAFPESANVGFVQLVARDHVRLRVYERGVGETLACGSGACAASAVLMGRDLIDREVTVSLPGGDLQIAWPDDASEITMAGPAAFVFEGEWSA